MKKPFSVVGPEASRVPLGRILTELATAAPTRPAVTCEGVTVSRAELESNANRRARALESLGVRADDVVTVALPNGVAFYETVFALWKLGAVPQPLSHRLPLRERSALIGLAQPTLIVGVEPGIHDGIRAIPASFEPDPSLSSAPLPDRVSPAWKIAASGGSTGRPKLIVSGQRGELDPITPGALLGQRAHSVQLVAGPLYHNAPFNFSFYGLFAGQHLVVLPRFDTVGALEAIEGFSVEWASFVPTMMLRIWRELLRQPGRWDIASLKHVWHGGAPCPPAVKEAWIHLVGAENLVEMYAATENQMSTLIRGTEWLVRRGSVGRPLFGEVKVVGTAGETLPPGEVGEIFMRPPAGPPPYRYVGAEARVVDGWESLGDMGWVDAEGYLYVSDRRADLILTGGANVYPAEVEAALMEHPEVESCVAIGLPDDELGQRVHAIVQARSPLTGDGLRAFVADRLVSYKVPRSFVFTDEPLRDDAGKVRRGELREREVARTRTPTR